MSETSRSGFTVTLGRSGRVVKRGGGGVSEEGYRGDDRSKRSIRDRLGGNSDDRYHPYSKRQRVEGNGASSLNDMHLRKDDLRYKLMQKNSRQSENSDSHGNIDLRDKLLSRTSRPSVDSKAMRRPESAASTRYPMVEHRDTGITRHPMVEPREVSILGRYPSSRNPSELSTINAPARTYSSWTLDNLRRRSPERLYHSSARRGLSPERSREELQRRPMRAYDDGRSSSSMRMSPPRHVNSSSYITKSSVPAAPVKSAVPLPTHYPQASGIVHKIPSMIDEHPSVESFLQSLGLEKYAIFFKAEEIDMNALKQLGDNDLKELGIPMGPRKKILQSLVPRVRRNP